jgi:hydroxymethylglutaryl-CoA reductase
LNSILIPQAHFQIPLSRLSYKGFSGEDVAYRIVEAYQWACDDPFRAVTHNKGIMNGIDAVALATGQDWRAVEASAHAWAALQPNMSSSYGPLSHYQIELIDGVLNLTGRLELPISVGTKGGVLKTNPMYQAALGFLNHPNSKDLGQILVCVGLAQNFAALRALCTEGIQKGHMVLHAQNIAVAGMKISLMP